MLRLDGAQLATINRAIASLRTFFTWAHKAGLISHNPTKELRALPVVEGAPCSMPPAGIDWLLRAITTQADPTVRLRDLALLALLSDCGVRSQEAADVQRRDLDLGAAMLTVRSGKGRKVRRVQLTQEVMRTLTAYLKVRCPAGLPPIGSMAERGPLLMEHNMTKAAAPWEPGLTTVAVRKHVAELRQQAVALIRNARPVSPAWSV